MDAGDSSGRRRCFAVVDRDLTGAKSVGIGAVIAVFRRRFPKSPISKFSETRANSDLEKIAENRDLGVVPGQRGSRAAGERCPALPGLPDI
ncbi:hypothetical protein CRG98_013733 [Punica granatum]|uniref:Uncharacterized protein n=1 Tax=Punica granatum TaxID=22663 RepID=A0A2I0KBI2_PUNGR|nr:hypothetical protein CRG98_013733 [Punica granatum]